MIGYQEKIYQKLILKIGYEKFNNEYNTVMFYNYNCNNKIFKK